MLNLEKQKQIIQQLKPIDDAFAEKLFEDIPVCQEVLATILEDPGLTITEVIPQNTIKNLQGRSVRLDALCKKSDGSFCNIELQKADKDNHLKRTRYNAACITANVTDPGNNFEQVPEVYVIYISRFDLFRDGKTIYHMENVLLENNRLVDNGQHVIFVNTKVDDGTKIAELMQCFEQTYVDNPNFPQLSKRVQQFKDSKEVNSGMCELLEEYAKEYAAEHVAEYAQEYAKEYAVKQAMDIARRLFESEHTFEQTRMLISEELLTDEELRGVEAEVQQN